MDFTLSFQDKERIDVFRQFVEKELIPLEPDFSEKSFTEMLPVLEEKRQKAKDLGLWAPHFSEEYGGMGLSLVEFAHISEVLGQTPMGHYIFNCQAPDVGNMEILHHFGTEQQKELYLKPLAAGKIRSCFAMTEPDNPGSNPTWMSTTAVKDGDDYVINGHKWFTTAADGAAFTIVMAITDSETENRYTRASQIIVPLDNPGYHNVRNISVMGHKGDDYASHSEVRFENCRVPQSNILGEEGGGFMIAQERLGPGRIHHCMRWIGICERAFSLMCNRAATRQISPGKSLGTKQIVQAWIAESRAEINAARWMVLHAAWKIDNEGAREAREEISLIKFYVANVLQSVLDRAIQVHGALGMTDDTPLAFWYSHERAARIYDGADEVHKMVIAKRILRKLGTDTSSK